MKAISDFGNGIMDTTVDMWYYSENDMTNPKFLGNVFPFIGNHPIEKFYEYGILDKNSQLNFLFLQQLNERMETYNILNIIPLTAHTILYEYKEKKEKSITYYGLNGCYNRYITYLINGIEKIDLLSINLVDIGNFKTSDEIKVYKTDYICGFLDTDLFYIEKKDVINYLLHILTNYLPSNVNLHLNIMKIINDDLDEISTLFIKLLDEKSNQLMETIKQSTNSNNYKDERIWDPLWTKNSVTNWVPLS